MEDIEYLEEYEDLVLPALNSAAAAAAASSTSTSIQKNHSVTEFIPKSSANDDDGSSSSLDQDIFNCLFDDHSDDDNVYIEKIDDNNSLKQKRESSASLDSLDLLVDDLGQQVAKEIALQKAQQEQKNKIIIVNAKSKASHKVTPSTPKPKTFVTKPSVVPTVSLNTNRNTTATQQNKNLTTNKQKSIATVRPTIQNKQQQQQRQNTTLIQRSSFIQQQQIPSSSTATTSSASFSSVKPTTSRSVQLPVLARKPLSSGLSSSPSSSAAASTLIGNKFKPNPVIKPTIIRRPATIVKPEKIITKDPVEDPLNLDDLSEEASDNYSVSDISGETYNSISDFYEDDDEDDYSGDNDEHYDDELADDISNNSQIIELSNDSSGSTLNLEDLRASTPSPVISKDQDIPNNSFGFNKRKTKSPHLLRNRDILQGLLTKGEKPKLLELINQYAYKNNSSEEEEEINEVIDITDTRENLIENRPQTKVTITSDTIIIPIATTKKQDNKLSANNHTINPTHSDKNKSKTGKKSVTVMDNIKASGRDLTSPGAASDDSYLSAVEELLEESYAEAMKKNNDSDDPAVDELLEESYAEAMKQIKEKSTLQNQEVGAEMKVEEKLEVVGEQEKEVKNEPENNKQKITKMGIVTEYEDVSLDQEIKEKESNVEMLKAPENIQKITLTEEVKQVETNQNDKEEDLEKDKVITDNPLDITQQSSSKLENVVKEQPEETSNAENKTITKPSDSIKSTINESPNTRKKKRFRNLISPEPTENKELKITEETVTDGDDFKGFEEVDTNKFESTQQLNVINKNVKDQTIQKDDTTEKTKLSINESPKVSTSDCGSFKSPTKAHKSAIEKSKDKSSRDSSPTKTSKTSSHKSRDNSPSKTLKSSSDTKSKSSRDSSKDSKSSRDSSRDSKEKQHKDISKDRNSRESKDRSRESSKDSSKHIKSEMKSTQDKSLHKPTTETSLKQHHKGHRKSRDSKDSSKSRESSKSRDNKELKEKKSERKDSHSSSLKEKKSETKDSHSSSSSNVKNDSKSIQISKDKTDKTDKEPSKDLKISKEKEINTKQSEVSKDIKIVDKTKDPKDLKSATEKVTDISKNKETENMKKPQSISKTSTPSSSGKSLLNPVKVSKSTTDLKELKDKKDSPSSRDSSKDRKDVSKTKDSISAESDKKSKEIKKSGTSSHEYSKDRKDMTNPKDLKNMNKIHTISQFPKTLPKDSNESSTSKDVKNNNETNSLKDSKLAENSNKLKSSQDNKNFIKSKDFSKETKKVLNDNKSKHKEISLKQTPTKSSNLKKSTSNLNSTKDVLDNTKNENNPTSIKDSKEDKARDHAKSQEQNVSFEIVEMKKDVNTVVTKSEKLKPKETTDNKSKAKEAESVTKKTEKSENIILEKKTVLTKDTKEIKTKSEKLTLGRPIIKLTRIEDIKPKQVKKIGDIKTDDEKGEIKENKTTKVDNTKMEGSKSKESTVKPEIIDLKSNNTKKETGESKEYVTEKKDEERKCGIVEKKTEPRKLKIKRGNTKSAEVKSQESKDCKSQIIKSQEVSTLTETKSIEVKDKSMENISETKNPQEHKTEITQETEKTKSDTKDVVDKKVEESVENTKIKTSADSKSEEIKGVPDKKDKIPKPIKTRKTVGSKSEDIKSGKDTEKKLEETKDEENKDKTIEIKSQDEASVHDKNEEKSEPMKTRKTIGSEEAKASRDTDKNLGETIDESVELKSQEDASVHDKNEEKSEEPKSLETATATEKVDSEAKDKLEENNIIPMKTRKSFESKLEKPKSTKVAVTDETAVENKPEPRKTRNRHDSKSEDQKQKESSGNAQKEGENLVENKPEPRITRNRHDPKTEEQNSKETSDNAEKKEDNSKSETTSDNTEGLIKTPYDKSEENKPEPRKTRNRNDSKTEEQKSEETGGIAEETVKETKCETKSEKTTNLVETPNDESDEYKPEPRKTRNRHDSKAEEEKSKEPIEEPKSVKNEALLDKAKEQSVENKPEPRITRNRQDIKIEVQKSTDTNDNADKKVKENKSKTKSVKTAGLADKAEEVSLENKPEPRITRNRHDTKIDEQKSTETCDKAEQKVEENKSEIKSGKTAVLVDKAEEVLLENKLELVEENKSETSAEKTAGLKNEMVENKPEQRKTRNRPDLKIEEQDSKEISGNAEKEVDEIKTQKATGFEENVKNVSVKYKSEPRKTRNRLDSKTEEQNSTKTSDNAEKKVEIDESEITTEKTVDLEETAKNEIVENKLNPKETRNRNELKESEQISGNAENKAEESKSETKISDLEENVKDESVENKPEPRKTRSQHDSIIEEQKSKETSGNTEEKVEENKTETKSEKTAGLGDESGENKPETRKTRNRDDLKTDEQKPEEISGNAEKKAEETEIEKTAVLEERARDESLENKPEPRKTRNADKKVEETKSENKSVKTADIAEKTIDKSEENKPESRRTRNRHDSKTEDHKTSGNLEKQVEETKSETTSNKTAGLMKKTKDESTENKADPRITRSRYDSKSEELKSEETSQNEVKTVEIINIETVENTTGLKSDESKNKDTAKTVENIGEAEKNLEPVKSGESKTIVEEREDEHKEENQKEDLITVQNKPKVDKVLNTEKNTCAEKKIYSKEPEPNTSSSETSNNEKLKNEIENVTEYKTESLKDINETSSREETSTSQPTEEDLIKDNISVISDSSSISTTASISSSDTPTRRTLRKRGTESPFPENDNNKKIFKEPPAKSAMGTPKTAKNEKTPTDIVSPSSTISKRNLRSPGSEADTTQNLAKKPRLESPGRKSARFRNLYDNCLEEVELPVVTADINDFTSGQEIFSDITPDIPEVSQSSRKSIRREVNEDKNLEHVQEQTDKIREVMKIVETVVTKVKTQKEDKKDSTKTFDLLDPDEQVPKKLLPREVLNIEAIEETSTRLLKQENFTATKSSVSAKKSLRSEEVKTPKGIKKLDDKVETKLPLKKLHRGEVLDIETLETTPTESVDTSSLTLEHEDISNTKQNVNAKKALRSEDVKILKNIQTPLDETNIDSVIINKSPTKSPGSVLTFSDWLKNKTQTDATEHEDNLKSQQTATEESSKVEPKRKSKKKTKKSSTKTVEITKAKVENKESTDNPNNNTQEESMLHLEKEHSDKSTSMLDISDNTSTVEQESTLIDSMEITETALEDDNSLLEPALNQLTDRELSKKHKGRPYKTFRSRSKIPTPSSAKKQNTIETPQEIQQVSQDNITVNVTINEETNKSNISLDKSNTTPKPKPKKSERDLLIESMSKEMKEGGIQDLLNVDKHVKRQRLASRKKLTSSKEQLNTTTTETAEASISSDFSLVKESPKVIEFSDMAEVATRVATQAKDNTIKSPTKRQAAIQSNVKKSKKSLQAIDTLINTIVNDDGLSEEVPATSVIQDLAPTTISKSLTVEANNEATIIKKAKPRRRQAIQKEKKISKELQTTQNISAQPIGQAEEVASSLKQMPILTKSRKSLKTKDTMKKIITTAPITSPEVTTTALPVVTKSRKSMGSTKQQPINEAQIDMNDVNKVNTDIFKAPKPITHSAILNKIPTVENIKQLYTDTNKRPQSRNLEKFKHSKISSPTFKCRKLRVRLNRSLVKRYWISLKQRNVMTPVLISATSSAKVRENLHSASAIPVIQHNKETNLRIQSVVSTADVLNEPLESLAEVNIVTQDSVSEPEQFMPQNTIPGIIDNPPYFVPTTDNVTQSLDSEVPLELKYEFVDENPKNIENSILPDTPTLLARAQTITQAAQHALSNSITPTDIRLLTTESSAHAYVSSFGVSPTALNNKGTCLYTFLHPAKYNRNHSNVLLDFCCPNLDGPMPAIDPTRIHSQVQIPVIEIPACIVLTTKVVTRAELESKNSSIPAIIRKKAERIRSNIAAHHNIASAASTSTVTQSKPAIMTQSHLPPPPRLQPQIPQSQLSSTMNALAKHLPPTTTITPKIRPAQSQPSVVHQQPTVSVTAKRQPVVGNRISSYIQPLRSNLRRFDVLQKQLCQPFDSLTFVDRHRIIESIITSGKLSPKDLERTLILMEEYLTQISLLKSQTKHIYAMSAQNSPTTMPSLNQMPQLQPAPNILASSSSAYATATKQLEHPQNKSMRKLQTPSNRNTNLTSSRGSGEMEQRHVPIYDTDRNIIGYQLQPMSAKPTYTKSTMSSRTSGGIMSTSLENQITSYSISKRPMKRPAQDSPRVFYTTPPLHTSTPIATNPHVYNTNPSSSNALSQKTHQHKGSIVTTVRSSGGSNQSGSSETITTTTMATVKRVTRSTATGSKIIIVSKSNQSSEETILPDIGSSEAETAEIKNENDMEDFIG